MKTKGFKKVAAIISASALMLTIGLTALATGDTPDSSDDGVPAIEKVRPARENKTWENNKPEKDIVFTDEQKAQFVADAKEKLEQALSDGKITQEQYDACIAAIENGEMPFAMNGKGFGFKFGRGADGEQWANMEDMRSKMDEIMSKWDALTDEQKSEIYGFNDQKAAIDNQIIDKYIEFGIIDSETAASLKENIETYKNDTRTSGKMPGMGGRGGRGARGSWDVKTPDANIDTDTL